MKKKKTNQPGSSFFNLQNRSQTRIVPELQTRGRGASPRFLQGRFRRNPFVALLPGI